MQPLGLKHQILKPSCNSLYSNGVEVAIPTSDPKSNANKNFNCSDINADAPTCPQNSSPQSFQTNLAHHLMHYPTVILPSVSHEPCLNSYHTTTSQKSNFLEQIQPQTARNQSASPIYGPHSSNQSSIKPRMPVRNQNAEGSIKGPHYARYHIKDPFQQLLTPPPPYLAQPQKFVDAAYRIRLNSDCLPSINTMTRGKQLKPQVSRVNVLGSSQLDQEPKLTAPVKIRRRALNKLSARKSRDRRQADIQARQRLIDNLRGLIDLVEREEKAARDKVLAISIESPMTGIRTTEEEGLFARLKTLCNQEARDVINGRDPGESQHPDEINLLLETIKSRLGASGPERKRRVYYNILQLMHLTIPPIYRHCLLEDVENPTFPFHLVLPQSCTLAPKQYSSIKAIKSNMRLLRQHIIELVNRFRSLIDQIEMETNQIEVECIDIMRNMEPWQVGIFVSRLDKLGGMGWETKNPPADQFTLPQQSAESWESMDLKSSGAL